ncbi:MAG: hypothetical protein HRT98_02320 [Mycoplasmatales bacterium]|nr:hypothetical protein [Mycoplasmatales bacterium]
MKFIKNKFKKFENLQYKLIFISLISMPLIVGIAIILHNPQFNKNLKYSNKHLSHLNNQNTIDIYKATPNKPMDYKELESLRTKPLLNQGSKTITEMANVINNHSLKQQKEDIKTWSGIDLENIKVKSIKASADKIKGLLFVALTLNTKKIITITLKGKPNTEVLSNKLLLPFGIMFTIIIIASFASLLLLKKKKQK